MAAAETERTYIIPLRKAILKAPKYKRAKRAISEIRIFLRRHLKTETVKIGKHLNEHMWHRGIKNPPTKIKVNAALDEEGIGHVELFGKPLILKKEEAKEKKEEEKPKEEEKEKKLKKAAPKKKPGEKKLGKKALQKQLEEELKKKEAAAKKKLTPKKAPAKKPAKK